MEAGGQNSLSPFSTSAGSRLLMSEREVSLRGEMCSLGLGIVQGRMMRLIAKQILLI